MVTMAARSNAPVPFFTQQGTQVTVPISALEFQDGKLQFRSSYSGPKPSGIDAWLQYLASVGVVAAGDAPPRAEAITFTAARVGGTGNDVKIEIAYAGTTTYTVKATQIDVYDGLTPASVAGVLGTSTQAGSRPGLVRAKTASFTTPIDLPAQTLAGGNGTTAASTTLDFGSGESLVLEAVGVGDAGNLVTAAVSNSVPAAQTFTLTASFTQTVTIDGTKVGSAQIDDINNGPGGSGGIGFVVTASAPSGGVQLPQAGIFNLTGGADTTPAVKAAATALSSS